MSSATLAAHGRARVALAEERQAQCAQRRELAERARHGGRALDAAGLLGRAKGQSYPMVGILERGLPRQSVSIRVNPRALLRNV